MERTEQSRALVLGLDLGQQADYTAIVANELVQVITARQAASITTVGNGLTGMIIHRPEKTEGWYEHRVRHADRFPLKTPYPEIVDRVGTMIRELKARGHLVELVVDAAGVGRPVVEMFRHAGFGVPITAVTSMGGQHAKRDLERPSDWTVPKKDLVGLLQILFHQERFKIARELPRADVLIAELQNYRAKITDAGNTQFEAWRERDHDDLVFATLLAVWGADRRSRPGGLI